MEETLNLTQEWDKTFPKSEKVNHRKVTFHNRYGITKQIMRTPIFCLQCIILPMVYLSNLIYWDTCYCFNFIC